MSSYVIISDGLGNQMFQYAFMLALRAKGIPVKGDISLFKRAKMHNGFELQKVFGINDTFVSRSGLSLFALRCLLSLNNHFLIQTDSAIDFNSFFRHKSQIYRGYWQDARFLCGIEDEIRKSFTFMNIDSKNVSIVKELQARNSVSLHIRRGDYIGNQEVEAICNEAYYNKAISVICSEVSAPFFYVFSNDLRWAETYIKKTGVDYELVDNNQGCHSYKDMYLMTQCKHNIIANSSFSWWGAWLNANETKIVVAPKQWTRNKYKRCLQLDGWVLCDNE